MRGNHPAMWNSDRHAPALNAAAIAWRRQYLRQCGFAPGAADSLAGDARYDVHELVMLVRNGCPTALAARILAPLVGEQSPAS